jgi:hypothetical protein
VRWVKINFYKFFFLRKEEEDGSFYSNERKAKLQEFSPRSIRRGYY